MTGTETFVFQPCSFHNFSEKQQEQLIFFNALFLLSIYKNFEIDFYVSMKESVLGDTITCYKYYKELPTNFCPVGFEIGFYKDNAGIELIFVFSRRQVGDAAGAVHRLKISYAHILDRLDKTPGGVIEVVSDICDKIDDFCTDVYLLMRDFIEFIDYDQHSVKKTPPKFIDINKTKEEVLGYFNQLSTEFCDTGNSNNTEPFNILNMYSGIYREREYEIPEK